MKNRPLGALILAILITPSFIATAPTQSFLVIYTFLLAVVGASDIAYRLEQFLIRKFKENQ